MNGPRSVTATFQQAPPGTFSLDVSVTQGGSVTSSPPGIACPGDCNQTFNSGTTVTLTPNPAAGFLFSQWSGTGCTGGVVQMTQNRSCTATFVEDLPTTRVLTVTVAGSGTVTSTPAGINCGQDCTEAFTLGATVTLTDDAGRRLHVRRVVRRVRRDGPDDAGSELHGDVQTRRAR